MMESSKQPQIPFSSSFDPHTHTHRSHLRTMYFASNGTKPDEKDWLYDSQAQILLEVGVKTVP